MMSESNANRHARIETDWGNYYATSREDTRWLLDERDRLLTVALAWAGDEAAPYRKALEKMTSLAGTGGAMAHLNRHGVFSKHHDSFQVCTDDRCVKARADLDEARALLAAGSAEPDALRTALARAIEAGYTDESIDSERYHNDPIYHAIVWEIRKQRMDVTEKDWQEHDAALLRREGTPVKSGESYIVPPSNWPDDPDLRNDLRREVGE